MDPRAPDEPSSRDSVLDDSVDERPAPRSDSVLIVVIVAGLLALIWAAFAERTQFERKRVLEAEQQRDTALAVALEQYTLQVLKTARAVTQYVAREYSRGARGAALRELLDDRMANNDIFTGLAVVGADGALLAGSGRNVSPGPPAGTRQLFRFDAPQEGDVQVASVGDGPPGTRELSIARGVSDHRGRPDAIVVAFVATHRFLGVFEQARLGRDTLVVLASANGAIRATWNMAGGTAQPVDGVLDLDALERASPSSAILGGVPRLVVMRKIHGLPLVAIVATSEHDAWAEFASRQKLYFWASASVSLLSVLLAAALLHANRRRDRLAQRLQRARDRLRAVNASLESRIAQRTSQLASANRDLRLFTSALAHDVRAPLAAIDGFSQRLEPAIAASGDERLKHQLGRIRANVRHMSELTESMLQLARVSAHALHPVQVDLSSMAHTVMNGLRERDPDRQVDADIAAGLVAHADPVMLREVLENLLGNAWKFTARRAHARIRVAAAGEQAAGNEAARTFLVSDNGAGFDMAYAGAMFQPFQRMHAAHEFAGTGIGLAIVQRIVELHGGRVWAEGAVDAGATVYFTLPAGAPVTVES